MGQPVLGNRQAIMASSHRWKSSGAPPRKTSPRGRTSSHTTETIPGGGPQTETIAITQGHLPYNAESPPAAPIADSVLPSGGRDCLGEQHRFAGSVCCDGL